MATRDRTKLFFQFRKSYEFGLSRPSAPNQYRDDEPRSMRNDKNNKRSSVPLLSGKDDEGLGSELYELEEMGLILGSEENQDNGRRRRGNGGDREYQVIEMMDEPMWINIKDEVNEEIERFSSNFLTLESLHKKRLLPGFQDRTLEEKAIGDLAESLFGQLKRCHGLTRQLGQAEITQEAPLIVKNAQISLATRLQELSTQLQDKQAMYLKKLRARESLPLESESANLFEEQPQLQLVQEEVNSWEEAMITQREREIAVISDSIGQLADLFRSLQTMVIDQGTLLDRIDYNVESVAENVKDAVQELKTAVGQQRSEKSKYCILLLLCLIVLMILLIIIKSSFHH